LRGFNALRSGFHTVTPATARPKVAEIALMQEDNRLQTLIEGAKKEEELNVYLVFQSVSLITDAFAKKYGIKVNNWRSGSESLLQRNHQGSTRRALCSPEKSTHPHAAVLFYDFMLTEGQKILSQAHAIATSNKLDMEQKRCR
jgi:hypothetical protein